MGSLGRGFAQGLGGMLQLRQARDRLELEKKLADAKFKHFELEGEKLRRQLLSGDLLRQELTRTTEIPNPAAAGVDPEALAFENVAPTVTGPAPFSRRGIAQALVGGFPLEAGKLAAEPEPMTAKDLRELLTGLTGGGGPPTVAMPEAEPPAPLPEVEEAAPGAAVRQGGPPARAPRPAVEFQGFTLDPSTGRVSLKFGQNELDVKDSTVETAPGSGIFVHRRDFVDTRTGGTVGSQIMGRATTGEGVQRVEAIVRSWGLNPVTPLGQAAVGDVFDALAYQGPEEQNIALERVRQRYGALAGAPGRGQPGAPPRGGGGSVLEAARTERATRAEAETRARERGQRTAGKMGDQDRIAFQTQSTILANIQYIEDTFSDQEVREFVGLLNRPLQEAQMTARSVFGKTGSERFAEFKAANERLRASAFGEGGKQLTAFEASVVFGFTPTGRETGGATEYLAKMRNLKAVTRIARALRLELARTGAEAIDPEELDTRLRERMKKAGVSRAPAQPPLEIKSIKPVR